MIAKLFSFLDGLVTKENYFINNMKDVTIFYIQYPLVSIMLIFLKSMFLTMMWQARLAHVAGLETYIGYVIELILLAHSIEHTI